MREPRPPKDQPSSNRPPTSGWWYLLAPGLLAVGALAAGTLALVALAAAGRSVADQQVIPVADTAVLEVGTPGEFVVFARYGTSVGGQAVDEPQVVVLDPDGRGLTLDGPDPVQTWSDGDEELVAIGNLTTTSSGPHRVVVGPVTADLVTGVVVVPDPLVGLLSALGWALGIVVVSVIGAVVVVVVVALRRRRAVRGVGAVTGPDDGVGDGAAPR